MPTNQERNKTTNTTEEAAEESVSKTGRIKTLLKNERINFTIGIVLVIFSLYLAIAFISFLFTGSADQSKIENLSISELSSIKNDIQNWTGALGAYLSNLLINRWMGISAFIAVLWLYVVSEQDTGRCRDLQGAGDFQYPAGGGSFERRRGLRIAVHYLAEGLRENQGCAGNPDYRPYGGSRAGQLHGAGERDDDSVDRAGLAGFQQAVEVGIRQVGLSDLLDGV